MPAKRVILLSNEAGRQTAVLWADVPAGNQVAYADPTAESAYTNITTAELQAIRDGVVAEKVVTYLEPTGAYSLTNAQTFFQAEQTTFQSLLTAEVPWANYGRYWDGTAWNASPGVPMASVKESIDGLPTYIVMSGLSAFAANKFHLVVHNGASTVVGQSVRLKVRLVVVQPSPTVVTGVQSGVWTLRRREALTTPPSGTGGITIATADSGQALLPNVTAWNGPGVSPAGGTTVTLNQFTAPADEIALSTLNAPGMASILDWGGVTVWRSGGVSGIKPLVIRPNQTLEIQQDATGGTGNCRVLCIFTVG